MEGHIFVIHTLEAKRDPNEVIFGHFILVVVEPEENEAADVEYDVQWDVHRVD